MPEQESREISFEVGPDSLAPREARHRVADELVDVAGIDAETAELLVSELVTNVVRHAGTPAHVRLVIDVDCVRVEVADGSPDATEGPAPSPTSRDRQRDAHRRRPRRPLGHRHGEHGLSRRAVPQGRLVRARPERPELSASGEWSVGRPVPSCHTLSSTRHLRTTGPLVSLAARPGRPLPPPRVDPARVAAELGVSRMTVSRIVRRSLSTLADRSDPMSD